MADKKEEKQTKEQKKPNVKKAAPSKGKKKWCNILAPKSFNSMLLGESHVENAEKLIGKTLTANLMTLTGDMRNQGVEIRFDVVAVQEGHGITVVTGYELLPSTMKRLIRRGRNKVSDSFVIRTATGRLVRIKPIVLTANLASSGACTTIRKAVRDKVKQIIKGLSFDVLVQDVISYKLQRALKDVANKTHPVKNVEIRMCNLLPEGAITGDDAEMINVVDETKAPQEESNAETVTETVESDAETDTDADDAEPSTASEDEEPEEQ